MKPRKLVVIGGGVLGALAAIEAGKRGLQVLLIEANSRLQGATVRNFGQVVPSGQSIPVWRELGIRSLELYAELNSAVELPVRNNGSLYVASTADESVLLDELADIDRQASYKSERLTARQSIERTDVLSRDYVDSGLFYSQDCTADPRRLGNCLLDFLRDSSGHELLLGDPVVSVDRVDGGFQVRTESGLRTSASDILVTPGHQLPAFIDKDELPELPTIARLQMLSGRFANRSVVPCNILSGLTIRRYGAFRSCPSHADLRTTPRIRALQEKGIHLLISQMPDGELRLGDSHDYFPMHGDRPPPFDVDLAVNDMMREELERVLSPEAGASLRYETTWNGYYCDAAPGVLAHTQSSGVHLLTGIGGKGMTTAPAVAERVVKAIVDGESLGEYPFPWRGGNDA